jgi:hypothetical protein
MLRLARATLQTLLPPTHLASCPSRNRPTNSSDEPKFQVASLAFKQSGVEALRHFAVMVSRSCRDSGAWPFE